MKYVVSELANGTGVWASTMADVIGLIASSASPGQGVVVAVFVFPDACGPATVPQPPTVPPMGMPVGASSVPGVPGDAPLVP